MLAVWLTALGAADASWWLAAAPCPAGAHLQGRAPPSGLEVACVDAHGAFHGRRTQWWQGGARQSEGEYRRGVAHGHWVFWRKSGQRALEGNYWAGKKSGRWTRWPEKGAPEVTEHPTYDTSDTAIDAAIA